MLKSKQYAGQARTGRSNISNRNPSRKGGTLSQTSVLTEPKMKTD